MSFWPVENSHNHIVHGDELLLLAVALSVKKNEFLKLDVIGYIKIFYSYFIECSFLFDLNSFVL
jgi:hypothetical protein